MGLTEFQSELVQALGPQIKESGEARGDFWIRVDSDHYLSVLDQLRGEPYRFSYFIDLCGVDYIGESPRFEVVVHLESRERKERVRVKCRVPDETLTIPSLSSRWTASNWQERETFDMYGIRFSDHPNLTRILSAPDVTIFPQRKDYPLKGPRDPGEDL